MTHLQAWTGHGCRLALLLAVAGASACGDDAPAADGAVGPVADAAVDAGPPSDAAPPDAATPTTVAALCGAIRERLCAGLDSCGCRFDVRPYDAEGCAAYRTADCVARFEVAVQPDIEAGHAALDGPSIDSCLGALDRMVDACGLAADGWPDACAAIFVATADLDETCTVTGGGLAFCAGADGLCIPGSSICTALPGEGATCFAGFCAAGLGCDFGSEGSICIPIGGAGSLCNSDRTCAPETFCDFTTLSCAARYPTGAACSAGNECAVGDECGLGPTGFHCSAIPGRGEPCLWQCQEGLACKGPGG